MGLAAFEIRFIGGLTRRYSDFVVSGFYLENLMTGEGQAPYTRQQQN